jgi:tRNA threonylcarbamoyladenosine biosynthesis protein TsaE
MSKAISTFTFESLSKLPIAAEQILEVSEGRKVFAFHGEMGTGKTTIIKEICKLLDVHDNLSSPSYGIVNEYQTANNKAVYHIDLYRLNEIEEALAIGIEDYITGYSYCFIEWPELIESLLPENTVSVYVTATDNVREINIFMG